MDELLSLLERYDPGYRGRIEGAGFWQIDALEATFGRPLPGFYRQFAEAMGAGAGPLLADLHAYHPNDIADLYEFAPCMPPRRFLYVFGDPSVDAQHYFLDLDTTKEGEDNEVVRFPFGKEAWKTRLVRRFVSLREMLFVKAMTNVHLPTFPHRAEYYRAAPKDVPTPDDIAALFAKLGFVKLPYPRRCMLFERSDAAINLYRRPDTEDFSFQVGMRDAAELRRFGAIIQDHTELVRWS